MNWSEYQMANVVLLVEDNEDHAEMVKQSFGSETIIKEIHWVKDGQEALDFLQHKGKHTNAPRPTLILLDLNLPKASGLEVLQVIKADYELKVIPVVMLTSSDRNDEILECYRLGVNSFITKPVKFEEYLDKLQSLERYWLATNREPSSARL